MLSENELKKLDDAHADLFTGIYQSMEAYPKETIALFKSTETAAQYMRAFYYSMGLASQLGDSVTSFCFTVGGKLSVLMSKGEIYVLEVTLAARAGMLLAFNKEFTIHKLAFRLDPYSDYTILPSMTTFSMAEKDVRSYSGGTSYYTAHAMGIRSYTFDKPEKQKVMQLTQSDVDKLIPVDGFAFFAKMQQNLGSGNAGNTAARPSASGNVRNTTARPSASGNAGNTAARPSASGNVRNTTAKPTASPSVKPAAPKSSGITLEELERGQKKYEGKSDEEIRKLLGGFFTSDFFKAAKDLGIPLKNAMDVFDWSRTEKIQFLVALEKYRR